MLSQVEAPGLLDPATAERMAAWWAVRPTSPLVLTDVLTAADAAELLGILSGHDGWQREHVILNQADWTEQVDAEAFAATPAERRFNTNERLPLERVAGAVAADRLQGLMGSKLVLDHLSKVTGQRVIGPIMEFARYRQGDFLAEHKDTFNARVIGLVLYLSDAEWQEDFGGCLGYHNETVDTFVTLPTFNTMSVFPFRTDCAHWVSPVSKPGVTRYSVALHYTDAAA